MLAIQQHGDTGLAIEGDGIIGVHIYTRRLAQHVQRIGALGVDAFGDVVGDGTAAYFDGVLGRLHHYFPQ